MSWEYSAITAAGTYICSTSKESGEIDQPANVGWTLACNLNNHNTDQNVKKNDNDNNIKPAPAGWHVSPNYATSQRNMRVAFLPFGDRFICRNVSRLSLLKDKTHTCAKIILIQSQRPRQRQKYKETDKYANIMVNQSHPAKTKTKR